MTCASLAELPPTARVYCTPKRYEKLSPRARRTLAAVELANADDARCWYAALNRLRKLTGYTHEEVLGALMELRDRRVIDLVLVVADTTWWALVAPWRHRARLASAGADLIHARTVTARRATA